MSNFLKCPTPDYRKRLEKDRAADMMNDMTAQFKQVVEAIKLLHQTAVPHGVCTGINEVISPDRLHVRDFLLHALADALGLEPERGDREAWITWDGVTVFATLDKEAESA